jgi:hypothetical protein
VIRQYNHKTDFEGVKALCEKHKINFPSEDNFILVAVENDEIIGITGIKLEMKIEPLIADNPMIAFRLSNMIEGAALNQGANVLYANVNCENTKHINQLEKYGYEVVETSKVILRKEF